MKKLFALILAMAMALTLLAGCASTAAPEKADSTPAETTNGTDEFMVGFSIASLDYPYYVTMKRLAKRRDGSPSVLTPVTTLKKRSTTATT